MTIWVALSARGGWRTGPVGARGIGLLQAVVRGTTERLTQPAKIAIVYSHASEAGEWREYIGYLQKLGYLTREVEDLELEELPGAQGLRALRVTVDLTRRETSAPLLSHVSRAACPSECGDPSAPQGKRRDRGSIERAETSSVKQNDIRQEHAHVVRESVEVEMGQGASLDLVASTRQERVSALHVAVDEMLEAHGDLDEPLERHAVAAVGLEPARFQQLVHFEVEAGVEEERRGVERALERGVRRSQRACLDHPPCPRRPLAEVRRVLPPFTLELETSASLLEEGARYSTGQLIEARLDAERGHGIERSPRLRIVERGQNQLGERVPKRKRQRHAA